MIHYDLRKAKNKDLAGDDSLSDDDELDSEDELDSQYELDNQDEADSEYSDNDRFKDDQKCVEEELSGKWTIKEEEILVEQLGKMKKNQIVVEGRTDEAIRRKIKQLRKKGVQWNTAFDVPDWTEKEDSLLLEQVGKKPIGQTIIKGRNTGGIRLRLQRLRTKNDDGDGRRIPPARKWTNQEDHFLEGEVGKTPIKHIFMAERSTRAIYARVGKLRKKGAQLKPPPNLPSARFSSSCT